MVALIVQQKLLVLEQKVAILFLFHKKDFTLLWFSRKQVIFRTTCHVIFYFLKKFFVKRKSHSVL